MVGSKFFNLWCVVSGSHSLESTVYMCAQFGFGNDAMRPWRFVRRNPPPVDLKQLAAVSFSKKQQQETFIKCRAKASFMSYNANRGTTWGIGKMALTVPPDSKKGKCQIITLCWILIRWKDFCSCLLDQSMKHISEEHVKNYITFQSLLWPPLIEMPRQGRLPLLLHL